MQVQTRLNLFGSKGCAMYRTRLRGRAFLSESSFFCENLQSTKILPSFLDIRRASVQKKKKHCMLIVNEKQVSYSLVSC